MQSTPFSRRSFLAMQSVGGSKPLRVGFVGVGERGSYHLDVLLGMDVEIKALCDVDDGFLYRARKWVTDAGRPAPTLYGRGPSDYLRLVERDDLDLVIISTPWQFHAPVCLAAMRAGKHAATEVPAAQTVEECWELVERAEKSRKHCVMLEQSGYFPPSMTVLNMAQQGILGELLHAAGGYVHDLRLYKFDPAREPWRLQYSVDRNGNNYPTHPTGPMAWWLNINRGDKFDYLVSMSTKARCLNDYAAHFFGERHPYASTRMACGDVNTTMIYTSGGKTVTLHHDTNTPHPQTSELRLQGTRGLYIGNTKQVYLEGRTPQADQWEPLANYTAQYEHPIWKNFDQEKFQKSRGHGDGAHTPLLWMRLIEALKTGRQPDQNVFDAVTWSVISPLTQKSVAARSRPVDFPDFTRGAWQTTPPIQFA